MSSKKHSMSSTLTPALQKALEKKKAMKDAGISIEILNPLEKAQRNPKSLRMAINAKCWDCVGAGFDPSPRKLIRECSCESSCALYNVRPFQK